MQRYAGQQLVTGAQAQTYALLNAYAFSKFGHIAGIASHVGFVGGALPLVLAALGLWYAARATATVTAKETSAAEEAETELGVAVA